MIDPKELRIGSHYYNGSYNEPIIGRVLSINGSINNPDDMSVGLIYDMPLDNDSDPYEAAMLPYLEPIPITEELLTELGFVNTSSTRRIVYTKGCEYDGLWVEVRNLKDQWEVFVSNNDWDGRMAVRYLHELEAFLYLTTKTELIKE